MSVEDSPEFQKVLKDACDAQWGNWLYGGGFKKSSRRNVEKTLARIQEIKNSAEARVEAVRKKAETIRRETSHLRQLRDPMLKRITENIRIKSKLSRTGLVCPNCGAGSRVKVKGVTYVNHKVNGKPWCPKCNVELVSPKKIEKWVNIKQGDMDGVRRQMRGLP